MPDPLSNLPGYALRRAANAMMADLTERLAPIGLRIIDASLILLVAGRRDRTSSDIGRMLDIQRANMVPLLNRLEASGLIARVPLDKKKMAIVLTPAGDAMLAQVRAITNQFEEDLIARIPEPHRPHFMPALHALWSAPAE